MKKLLAVVLIAAIVGCIGVPDPSLDSPGTTPGTDDIRFCAVDADCVAEQCCHPTSAVNHQFAPDCTDVVCSAECVPNTVDCGQGYFTCINNQCQTIINAPL